MNKVKEAPKKAIKPLSKSEAGVKKTTKNPVIKKVATKKSK